MTQYTKLGTVSATHKGEFIVIEGVRVGGVGIDGRAQHTISRHNRLGFLACDCERFIFQRGPRQFAKPCKHIDAYRAQRCGAEVVGGGLIRKVACEVREVASA